MNRETSLRMRGDVAMSGNFGYELDITKLNLMEKEEVKEQTDFYKKWQYLIQFGDFYRLLSSFEVDNTAWMFIDERKENVLVFYYKRLAYPQESFVQLRLEALDASSNYITDEGIVYGGDELMYMGLPIPVIDGDFHSYRIGLTKILVI